MIEEQKGKKQEDEGHVEVVPPWVMVMYNTIFFVTCSSHDVSANAKRNYLDRFCVDCAQPLCSICLLLCDHDRHNHVKIRRYMYNDVIKKQDLNKIFNCHGIQTYYTNKAKVIFLKQRSQVQKGQAQAQVQLAYNYWKCIICGKSLQDNSLFCSIACKVTDIHRKDEKKETSGGGDSGADSGADGYSNQNGSECNYKEDWTKKTRRLGRRKGFPLRAPMF